jgi:hypothetical protein
MEVKTVQSNITSGSPMVDLIDWHRASSEDDCGFHLQRAKREENSKSKWGHTLAWTPETCKTTSESPLLSGWVAWACCGGVEAGLWFFPSIFRAGGRRAAGPGAWWSRVTSLMEEGREGGKDGGRRDGWMEEENPFPVQCPWAGFGDIHGCDEWVHPPHPELLLTFGEWAS